MAGTDDSKWTLEALECGRRFLTELDTLRVDRPVVYLDTRRTRRVIGQVQALFHEYGGIHEEFLRREPPILCSLLWTGGDCFGVSDLEEWRSILTTRCFERQLERPCQLTGQLPIHVACQASTEKMILHLLNRNNAASLLSREDTSGMLPFQAALRNKRHPPTFQVWKRLLKLYPDAYEYSFCRAMENEMDFVEAFVRWFPRLPDLVLEDPNHLSPRLNLEHMRYLCKLLPKIDKLRIKYKAGLDKNAVLHLLSDLAANGNSIEEFEGLRLPRLVEQDQEIIVETFQQMVASCRWLQKLKVEIVEDVMNFSRLHPLFLSLKEGLMNVNQNGISQRDVTIVVYCNDGATTTTTAAAAATTSTTTGGEVKRSILLCGSLQERRNHQIKIEFHGHDPGDDSVGQFLETITPIFQIRSLTLKSFPTQDLVQQTQPLASVLRAMGRHLQSLDLEGFDFHIPTIFDALKSNPKIQVVDYRKDNGLMNRTKKDNISSLLELLMHHNTSLRRCRRWSLQDPRIQYYLDLNRLGREQVRTDNNMSSTKFINLLQTASNDWFQDSTDRKGSQHSVLYGLLREAPDLWCHYCLAAAPASSAASDKKRKRNNLRL